MPNISYNYRTKWTNYHRTEEHEIREIAHVYTSDLAPLTGVQRFAATGKLFNQFIATTLVGKGGLAQQPPARSAVMVGTAWSFSKLSVADDLLLELTGLSGMGMAQSTDMHADAPLNSEYVALVSGGTRLRELVEWAKPQGRSIRTSGSFLGSTIAGSFGTSSHGSRLRFGGIQNMIHGLHIITGSDSSVWLERASKPVLNRDAALRFATRVIRDDAMFEDALVHLGGMGIINGVAIELVDDAGYYRLAVNKPIDEQFLTTLAAGDYRALAKQLGYDGEPIFYELTFDPRGFDGPIALHTMFFEGQPPALNEVPLEIRPAADAITAFATNPEESLALLYPAANGLRSNDNKINVPNDFSVLKLYAQHFFAYDTPPASDTAPGNSWLALHAGELTGGVPGALYNASYAIDRGQLVEVLTVLSDAMKTANLPQSFLFTVRLVSDPAGAMAFTRFKDNIVLEIDGIGKNSPFLPELGPVIVAAAKLLRKTLDEAGIEYSLHWGKLGDLDKAKVHADFGPANDPKSRLGRWRATRDALLDGEANNLFRSEAHYALGLLERPIVSE